MKNPTPLALLAGLTLLVSGLSHAQPLRLPAETPIPTAQFLEHALEGRMEAFQAAMAAGMSPSLTDENGRTPLMLSAFNGHREMVAFLLEQGVKVNVRDGINRTALMYAATGPHPDSVDLLLKHGAEVNAVDSHEHFTALMFAAAEGHRPVVELLLKHGANPSLKDSDGDTAATFAAQRGHQELAAELQAATDAYGDETEHSKK